MSYKPASIHTCVGADMNYTKSVAHNSRLLREDMPWLHALRSEWYLWVVKFMIISIKKYTCPDKFLSFMDRPTDSVKEVWLIKETESQVQVYKVPINGQKETISQAISKHGYFRVNDPINFIVVIDKGQIDCCEPVYIFRCPQVIHPGAEWRIDDLISDIINKKKEI